MRDNGAWYQHLVLTTAAITGNVDDLSSALRAQLLRQFPTEVTCYDRLADEYGAASAYTD